MLSGVENPVHWLIVIVIALIVLGPKRLPEVGRSLGNGIRSFRDAMSDGGDADDEGEKKSARLSEADEPPAGPSTPTDD